MNKLERIERLLPEEIEKRSFEIITEELNKLGIDIPKEHASIVKRAIHTSADFEYAHSLKFSPDAVKKVKELIINGADIVTDTNMALSGINKKVLAKYGGEVHCFMADEEVANEAKQKGATRAYISMQKASAIDKPLIFAIGNAPTALVSLYEMYQRNEYRPAFVIGVPVGFVNVELSKELIMETDIPFIVNEGRKGGSNIAAAICNAILYELDRKA